MANVSACQSIAKGYLTCQKLIESRAKKRARKIENWGMGSNYVPCSWEVKERKGEGDMGERESFNHGACGLGQEEREREREWE
eukprot:1324019-Amorphochlora_amoeboformis.AAC.1